MNKKFQLEAAANWPSNLTIHNADAPHANCLRMGKRGNILVVRWAPLGSAVIRPGKYRRANRKARGAVGGSCLPPADCLDPNGTKRGPHRDDQNWAAFLGRVPEREVGHALDHSQMS